MLLNLLRPLLVENLNYKAKQPTFHFGKEKNNTSFQLHYRPGPVIYWMPSPDYTGRYVVDMNRIVDPFSPDGLGLDCKTNGIFEAKIGIS